MVTIANGCPKSGTHALLASLKLEGLTEVPGTLKAKFPPHEPLAVRSSMAVSDILSLPNSSVVHGHIGPHVTLPEGTRVVTILRYPRNVVASYCRAFGVSLIKALSPDGFLRSDFVKTYRAFLGWREIGNCVLFEELDFESISEVHTETYNREHTDWMDYWTNEAEKLWVAIGGKELEQEYWKYL